MSLTTGVGKEGLGLNFLLFLLAQRTMKRHTENQREGQSVRLSARHRGC
jgi:hypothetical protein